MSDNNTWKLCSSCKSPIAFGQKHWVCSVSTCNRSRLPLWFCKVSCWDAHLPLYRHRLSAYAVEKLAPSRKAWEQEQAAMADETAEKAAREARREAEAEARAAETTVRDASGLDTDVLIVASRLKELVEARAELRIPAAVLHTLSHLVRRECDLAIEAARADGRKTVLDRDFLRPPAGTRDGEVLVIVSRVKSYIKARAGMNTAGAAPEVLSAHVRSWMNQAIRVATGASRGALAERDFDGL